MNMVVNPTGLIAAVTAFLSIWIGHISVRKIEAITSKLWQPMVIFFILGIAMEVTAGMISSRPLSMIFGIAGINALWSVLELKRQAGRVRKGHARANPNNPRHAAMLAEPDSRATMLDPLSQASFYVDMAAGVSGHQPTRSQQ